MYLISCFLVLPSCYDGYMPALKRITKQTTYLVLYVIIFTLIISFVVVPNIGLFTRNRDREAPPPREAVVIESVDPVIHSGSVDIVARVRNPNPNAGVASYDLTFILVDNEGNEIKRYAKNTYLLPGSLNYIPLLDIPATSDLAKVNVEAPTDINYVDLPPNVSAPTFNSFLQARRIRTIGTEIVEEQKGIVTNTGTLGYRHVEVTGVAFSSSGEVIGVSTTFMGQLQVGEGREFTLQWPAPSTPTERVIVIPTTNVYEPDNILDVKGDPGQLRGATTSR